MTRLADQRPESCASTEPRSAARRASEHRRGGARDERSPEERSDPAANIGSESENGTSIATADEEVRVARAGLLRLTEAPAPAVARLIDRVGVVQAWAAVCERAADRQVLAETASRCQDLSPVELAGRAEADLVEAAGYGARLVVPEDPQWPAQAMAAFAAASARGVSGATAPLGLYVRGADLAGLPNHGLAIVGSRACSPYGQRCAADLAMAAAADGLTIVSGAAYGVDAAAHRGALATEGPRPTLAVLACGIERAYPLAHRSLIEAIADRGAVVTEYPPGTPPARHRFLVRNRLIAALAAGTLVVEAGRRSGTLSTAAAARHLARVLMAVPGPITSALSVGCHHLIRDGHAVLVADYQHLRELVGPAGDPTLFDLAAESPGEPSLSPETLRVQDALSYRASQSVAEVTALSAVSVTKVLTALAELEIAGMACRDTGGWRARRPGGAPRRAAAAGIGSP